MSAADRTRAQAGLSLVELMVATTLGIALSFAAVTFLLQGKLAHVRDRQTARVQENARYAQRYLARELAMLAIDRNVSRGSDAEENEKGQSRKER